jgi:hypothetical protein
MKLQTYLTLAGLLHFAILAASASVPKGLNWRENLAPLHPFLRRLFWVYGVFIVIIIISFGTLTLAHASNMANGEPVAKSLCAFIAIFWAARLVVQLFVFDARPFLTNWFYKTGYQALTLVFTYFAVVYGYAFFK